MPVAGHPLLHTIISSCSWWQVLQSSLNITITAALPLAPYVSAEGIADADAEAGERELVINRHLQVIGVDFPLIGRDEEVVYIQAEAEFVVQQAVQQAGIDAVSRTHQVDALVLARGIGTGKREEERFLGVQEESVAQTGIIRPAFFFGRGAHGGGSSAAVAYSVLHVGLQPLSAEGVGVVQPEGMSRHKVLPKEGTDVRFGVYIHRLEEYIVGVRVEGRHVEVVLQRVSHFGIVGIAGLQVLAAAGIGVLIIIEGERIDHVLRRTGDAVGEAEVQRMSLGGRIKEIDGGEQAGIVVLVRRVLRLGDAGGAGVLHTQAQLHGEAGGELAAIVGVEGVDLFFVAEVIVLHQRGVGSIVIDAVAGVGEGCLGAGGYFVGVERQGEVEGGREHIDLAPLAVVKVEVGAGQFRSVGCLGMGDEVLVLVAVVAQVVHVPGHLTATVAPDFVGVEVQVEAVGGVVAVAVGVEDGVETGGGVVVHMGAGEGVVVLGGSMGVDGLHAHRPVAFQGNVHTGLSVDVVQVVGVVGASFPGVKGEVAAVGFHVFISALRGAPVDEGRHAAFADIQVDAAIAVVVVLAGVVRGGSSTAQIIFGTGLEADVDDTGVSGGIVFGRGRGDDFHFQYLRGVVGAEIVYQFVAGELRFTVVDIDADAAFANDVDAVLTDAQSGNLAHEVEGIAAGGSNGVVGVEYHSIHQALDDGAGGGDGDFVEQGGRGFQHQRTYVAVGLQGDGQVEVFAADEGDMQQIFAAGLGKGETALDIGQHTGDVGAVRGVFQQYVGYFYGLVVLVFYAAGELIALGE